MTDDLLLAKVRTVDKAFARIALTGVVKIGSEVAEEELQLFIEPLIRSMIYGEGYQGPTGEEMLETAIVTALSTFVMEGASVAGVELDYNNYGKLLQEAYTKQELIDTALKISTQGSDANTLAQKLYSKIAQGQVVSDSDIGRMYTLMQSEEIARWSEVRQKPDPERHREPEVAPRKGRSEEARKVTERKGYESALRIVEQQSEERQDYLRSRYEKYKAEIEALDVGDVLYTADGDVAGKVVSAGEYGVTIVGEMLVERIPTGSFAADTIVETLLEAGGYFGKRNNSDTAFGMEEGSSLQWAGNAPAEEETADALEQLRQELAEGKITDAEFDEAMEIIRQEESAAEESMVEGLQWAGSEIATTSAEARNDSSVKPAAENNNTETEEMQYGTEQADEVSGRDRERASERSGERSGRRTKNNALHAAARRAEKAYHLRNVVRRAGIERTSLRSEGLPTGSDEKSLARVPEELWTDDIKAAAKLAEDAGLELVPLVGTLRIIEGRNGRRITAAICNGKIYARADCDSMDIMEEVRHEIFHDKADQNPELVKGLMQRITARYTDEDLQQLFNRYYDLYEGVLPEDMDEVDVKEYIWGEMLADAYAEYQRYPEYTEPASWADEVREAVEQEERKNTADGGVRYAVGQNSATITQLQYDHTKPFADQIADYQAGNFPQRDTLTLGATPTVLKRVGLVGLPMTINQKHVGDALNGTYDGTMQEKLDHTFTPQELATLPGKIADPIAIIHDKRAGKAAPSMSNIDVIVEMKVASGKDVLVAIQVDGNGRINDISIDTNKVSTVHGNTDTITRLVDAINDERNGNVAVFYLNKGKTTKALQTAGNPIPRDLSNLDGFIHSITDPGSPVKPRISSVTESQQFKRWFGDWKKHPVSASKVVNADGTPKVMYHGTSRGGFTVFNTYGSNFGLFGLGSYFTDDLEVALSYTKKGKGNNPEVYAVYLNIRNPIDMDANADLGQWRKAFKDFELDTSYLANVLTNEDAFRALKENLADEYYEKHEAADTVLSMLEHMGYDGITHMGGGRFDKNDSNRHRVYIAFNPEQIKSATDNIGTFDGNNPDIRYSMAGESALTADEASLQMAKNLLDMDVSMEEILRTTGWYQGRDGKWRFEIDDSGMTYHRGGDAQFRKDHPEYARYRDLEVAFIEGTITEEEAAELRELHETWGREYARLSERVDRGSALLENILDHEELYAAYPALRDMKVVFKDLDGVRGEIDHQRGTITLDKSLRNAPESTLLHEIQHAIQNTEGFAGGSSPEYWQGRGYEDAAKRYQNTAGEIEARDVSRRRVLTAEERRQRMPDLGNENTVFAETGYFSMSSDERAGIREQLRKKQDELNAMEIVGSVSTQEYAGLDTRRTREKLMSEMKKTGYKVDRKGFGEIRFEESEINNSLNYKEKDQSAEDARRTGFLLLQNVLKRGIEIGDHGNHKGRNYDTVTIAAPIEINGERGNMAVVVKRTKGNRYKVHRILTPSGETFVLPEMANAEMNTVGAVTNGSQSLGGSTPAINSASIDIISKNVGGVNTRLSMATEETDALPAKAQSYLRRVERELVETIGEQMEIPFMQRRGGLREAVDRLAQEYLQNGDVSQQTVDELFDAASGGRYDSDADAREKLENAVHEALEDLRQIRRYADYRAEETAQVEPLTEENVKRLYAELKTARNTAEKAVAKNLLTAEDELQIGRKGLKRNRKLHSFGCTVSCFFLLSYHSTIRRAPM